ncbi:hypothetical protein ABT354_36185 [Streptomyces sp. NPDC000594]|uniref:hypothetical protein n=1 Tax=Streptomyces sp. NPDC000594 TaxID=3154261 RepID=UPI0033308C51
MRSSGAARIVYVHGIGNKVGPEPLKSQWDRALFGHELGAVSRMAYWAGVRHARPLPETAGGPGAGDPFAEQIPGAAGGEPPGEPGEPPEDFIARTLAGAGAAGPGPEAESPAAPRPRGTPWALEDWLRRMTHLADAVADTEDPAGDTAMSPLDRPGALDRPDPLSPLDPPDPLNSLDPLDASGDEVLPLPPAVRRPVFRALVKHTFTEVYAYFFGGDGPAMRRIAAAALDGLDADRGVVIGHSLGSVIAYEALVERGQDVALFLTAGSPLAVAEIRDQLLAPPAVPPGVRSWHNVCDLRDPVALGHLLGPVFPPVGRITDLLVANASRNHHGIAGYLRAPRVRALLHPLVTGPDPGGAPPR